jgi:hypothetical protein
MAVEIADRAAGFVEVIAVGSCQIDGREKDLQFSSEAAFGHVLCCSPLSAGSMLDGVSGPHKSERCRGIFGRRQARRQHSYSSLR